MKTFVFFLATLLQALSPAWNAPLKDSEVAELEPPNDGVHNHEDPVRDGKNHEDQVRDGKWTFSFNPGPISISDHSFAGEYGEISVGHYAVVDNIERDQITKHEEHVETVESIEGDQITEIKENVDNVKSVENVATTSGLSVAAIDGGWTSFGACTKTCEGGLQTRTCTNPPPEIGGQHCIGEASLSCNEGVECPPDKLYIGEKLSAGEFLRSDNEEYDFVVQKDGNMVVYQNHEIVLWNLDTKTPGSLFVFQEDGNLVLGIEDEIPVWSSGTQYKAEEPEETRAHVLVMQGDGILVLYSKAGEVLWASNQAYPGVKIDFGEPGKNVQEGFLKLGAPDRFGAPYTGTFPYEGKTAAIKISGHEYIRGNYAAVTNEFAYLSNLLRSSFLRNTAGTITVEISNLNPSTKYKIKTYHHSTNNPSGGVEFTLEYVGISVKTLKQSANGVSPDPPLIHTEIVTSNTEGKISFLMEKPDDGSSHMNLNGLEMSRAISGKR